VLSLITYKKPKEIKEFYIPEINETGNLHESKGLGENKKNNTGSNEKEKKDKGIKKPVSLENLQKQHEEKMPLADDNKISTDINSNKDYLQQKFNFPANKDFIIREFTVASKYKAFIAYLDGMVDRITINNFILRPLLLRDKLDDENSGCKLDFILQSVIETNQATKITKPDEAIYEILVGNTLLYVDGCDYYLTNETKGYDKRGVDKPLTEGVVMGAQEAFNETLRTSVTLIRKQIKNNNLTTEFFKIGDTNKNLCAIMYIQGLTNPAIVDEVKRRIKGIKADLVMGDGMLEQFIEDSPGSIVPTVLTTERPDRTASHILEGKVAILSEGTPFAKIVPVTLPSLMHSPEDSFLRWQFGTFIRLIRFMSAFIAILLPGLYVAVTNFHQEMIPTDLLIAIATAKENVPFPAIVEVLLMEISFELIREAGIRIPGIIGNTIGIIGALILGQAAVQANIVNPVLIIVVAITGLANFTIPNFGLGFSARLLRFAFIFSGAFLGFYGIAVTAVIATAFLMSIKSFGVPFYSTTSPKVRKSMDAILRWPIWMQELRPDPVNPQDVRRQPEISRQWTQEDANYSYDREDNND
ncbi:MAG TPA: spore germination protein, partial [Clostridia bacterium]